MCINQFVGGNITFWWFTFFNGQKSELSNMSYKSFQNLKVYQKGQLSIWLQTRQGRPH